MKTFKEFIFEQESEFKAEGDFEFDYVVPVWIVPYLERGDDSDFGKDDEKIRIAERFEKEISRFIKENGGVHGIWMFDDKEFKPSTNSVEKIKEPCVKAILTIRD